MQTPPTSRRTTWSDNLYKTVTAMLMASVAVLASIISMLQGNASSDFASSGVTAQRAAIEARGLKVSSQAQTSYALTSAQLYYEMGRMASTAEDSMTPENAKDFSAVQTKIAALSPLLAQPYNGNFLGYEAEMSVERLAVLNQQFIAANQLSNAYKTKAQEYVTHLVVLAVALFLYGLVLVVTGRLRWVMLGSGSALVAWVLISVVIVAARPVQTIPADAILAFGSGSAQAHQLQYALAEDAYTKAIDLYPAYSAAFAERASSRLAQGKLQPAADDYAAAIAVGDKSVQVRWNLAWTKYLQGQFDQAITLNRAILAEKPDLLPVRYNLALALLASGQSANATEEYTAAIAQSARQVEEAASHKQVVSFTFWYYLDVAGRDLQSLSDQLNKKPRIWTQASPAASVQQPTQVKAAADKLLYQVKSASTALETTGKLPAVASAVKVAELKFGLFCGGGGGGDDPSYPRSAFESGSLTGIEKTYYPKGVTDRYGTLDDFRVPQTDLGEEFCPYRKTFDWAIDVVFTNFDYQNIKPGAQVVWKTYFNGEEDFSLRRVVKWPLAVNGKAEHPIAFVFAGAGEYQNELYVDGQLVGMGWFTIEPEKKP